MIRLMRHNANKGMRIVAHDEAGRAYHARILHVHKSSPSVLVSFRGHKHALRIDYEAFPLHVVPRTRVSLEHQAVLPRLGDPDTADRSQRCTCGRCEASCCQGR